MLKQKTARAKMASKARAARPKVIIFAKAPYMGGAKTRLAAGIGKVHANRLYRAMTRTIIRRIRDARWETVLAVTPARELHRTFGGVWPKALPRIMQGTGSLTPRLLRAFSSRRLTIIIGTDAPQIKASDIARAIKLLAHNDLVLGPADDGGFWLIGLRGPAPKDLFDGVQWSTSSALSDVAKNAPGRVAYLRTLIDVDNVDALRAVRAQS
jgi:rSAM/selenodomain-associated transferase 1